MCSSALKRFHMQPAQRRQHRPAIFPTVHASNLNRRSFNLPADFEGERNLVIVAFQRDQQEVVDTWTAPSATSSRAIPTCASTSCRPSIAATRSFGRGWTARCGAAFPTHQSREQTITLYVDKLAFRQALGLPHEDTIYVLLVDRAGHVLWRGGGRVRRSARGPARGSSGRHSTTSGGAVGRLARQDGCAASTACASALAFLSAASVAITAILATVTDRSLAPERQGVLLIERSSDVVRLAVRRHRSRV